jgi:hypothetical protein
MTEWRCFHCDQVFTVIGEAQAHFGISEMDGPACQVSDEELRRMEAELDAYRADDTKLHREIHGLKSEHAAAVRAAEENGYAKALADVQANKLEPGHRALILAALSPENAQLRRGLLDAGAHLVAVTSLLRRGDGRRQGPTRCSPRCS